MLQLSIVQFKQGSYIFVEGTQQNDRFFIIQSGKVRFYKEVGILPVVNGNILGAGDFIGVIPCMSNHSQVESVIAETDVTAIAVQREQYPALIEKNTPVAMRIIMAFSQKMRLLNDILAERNTKQPIVSSVTQFYNVGYYYDMAANFEAAFFAYYQYLKTNPQDSHVELAKKRVAILRQRVKMAYIEPNSEDTLRTYPYDSMIFCEQQIGDAMFIIQEGQVAITKVIDNKEVVFAILKKGDFFGEMALLENKPRSASAIAHTECKVMVINRKNFNTMVSTQPQLISRLTTTLADRLWSMYRQVSNTFIPEEQARLFDMLALQIEKKRPESNSVQLDITFEDLANMCAVPIGKQTQALEIFKTDGRIRTRDGKIMVLECNEIIKLAATFRKKK